MNSAASDKSLLVIADGAAFGSQMNKVMFLVNKKEHVQLYLPESFEWLILKSGVIKDPQLAKILDNPSAYIDSTKWFSWERFFTDLLVERSADSYLQYTKKKINPNYLQPSIKNKILSTMDNIKI